MTLRTPHTGDRVSAAEDRLIVSQLQDQQTRDARSPTPWRPSEVTIFGEITEVLAGGGVPRYAWKMLYCDPFPIDPTYADSLMLGDNEDMPYLFEANRGAADNPSYSVGNRVLIHVILTANGAAFVVDSLPVGKKLEEAIATKIGVDYTLAKRYKITANTAAYVIDATIDWALRPVWCSIAGQSAETGPSADSYPNFWEEVIWAYGFCASQAPNQGQRTLITFTPAAWDTDIELYIDTADSGKMKMNVTNHVGGFTRHIVISAFGFAQQDNTTEIVIS